MYNHLCQTLYQASRAGHLECIKLLLNQGANVNEKNKKEMNIERVRCSFSRTR
jgi:ankyrin repeat protein